MKPTPVQIARLAFLTALTLIIQSLGLPQLMTGPLINTVLLITAHVLGLGSGIFLGIITPAVALIRGQLPAVLAPMLPFIAVGNGTLVFIYLLVRRLTEKRLRNLLSLVCAVIAAAFGKFLIILMAVRMVVPIFTGHRFPAAIETVMSLPQFLTAVTGGILFILIKRSLDRWTGSSGHDPQ